MSITRRVLRNMSFAFLSLFSSLLHSSFNPYIPLCVLFLDSLVLRFFPVFSIISIRMSCFNNRCCTTLPQQISIDLSLNVTICSLLSIWFEPKGNTRFWCWFKPKGNVCFNLQNKTKKKRFGNWRRNNIRNNFQLFFFVIDFLHHRPIQNCDSNWFDLIEKVSTNRNS